MRSECMLSACFGVCQVWPYPEGHAHVYHTICLLLSTTETKGGHAQGQGCKRGHRHTGHWHTHIESAIGVTRTLWCLLPTPPRSLVGVRYDLYVRE